MTGTVRTCADGTVYYDGDINAPDLPRGVSSVDEFHRYARANGYVKLADENHMVIHQSVLLSIINDLREKNGLTPLSMDELRAIAEVGE